MHAIEIKNLQKTYNNGFTALDGIDITVEEGDFYALLGPNGAGKSTTIGVLTSVIRKTEGCVKIFGVNIDEDFSLAKSHIGVVPQEFNINIFERIDRTLTHQAGFQGIAPHLAKPRIETLLKQLQLWDKREQLPSQLSGGMKRRLMIARALIHNPKLLILDEPTAGVDVELRHDMWRFLTELNNNGTTIILTTHYLEEAEQLCRNVGIINDGKIIQHGRMKDFLSNIESETFIIELLNDVSDPIRLEQFSARQIDASTLEASVTKPNTLNDLIEALSKHNLKIRSIQNKTNRLENLFLDLTKSKAK